MAADGIYKDAISTMRSFGFRLEALSVTRACVIVQFNDEKTCRPELIFIAGQE